MVMTIDATRVSKSIAFATIIGLVLHVILILNVCNHICDYNVDIVEWSCKCNYNLWLLHVWMEK